MRKRFIFFPFTKIACFVLVAQYAKHGVRGQPMHLLGKEFLKFGRSQNLFAVLVKSNMQTFQFISKGMLVIHLFAFI